MTDRAIWFPAYIGIGSNLDEPRRQVETTFAELDAATNTRLVSHSSLYWSEPFGGVEQPDFVNAVAALLTELSPQELLSELQRIETERGRERDGTRWGPRILDLDLLMYSSEVIADENLIVPHPGIGERNFVLLPLEEVAPELSIPGLGPIRELNSSARAETDNNVPNITRIR